MYLRYLANNNTSIDDPFHELIRIQSAHLPGYNPAIASSIRDGPIRSQAPIFVALGRQLKKRSGKVLLIWVRSLFSSSPSFPVLTIFSSYRAQMTRSFHITTLLA